MLTSPEKFTFVKTPKSPIAPDDSHSDNQLQNLFPVCSLLKNLTVSPMVDLQSSPSASSILPVGMVSPLHSSTKSEKRPSVFNLSFPHQLTNRIKKSESVDHASSNPVNDAK